MSGGFLDLGDTYPASLTIKDPSGAYADGGGLPVLTITLPDGTTQVPTIQHPSAGQFYYDYVTTQSGRHTVNWSQPTPPNAGTFNDVFYVAAGDPSLIIGLSDARAGLQLAATDTVNDDDLRLFIQAATPIMEDLLGPIVPKARTETYDGGWTHIKLLHRPVLSVASVVESYGSTYERTLTAQNIFDGSTVTAYGYDIDLDTGLIVRRVSGVAAAFPAGRRNVQVTYTAGRGVLQGNHLLAARRVIRSLYQSEKQGGRPSQGSPETPTYTPSGFAVAPIVIELCADALRPPGIA